MKVKLQDGTSVQVEFKEIRARKGASLLHKATHLTEARLRFSGQSYLLGVGRAYTSRKDRHEPFEGRKVALQRVLEAHSARLAAAGGPVPWLGENDRLRIWVAFFAHEYELIRHRPRLPFTGGLEYFPKDSILLKGLTVPKGTTGLSALKGRA